MAVTGGPAFAADIGKVFDGADVRLLGATAGVVALLLLITYRSPWLWLVPLSVVGTGDQVAAKVLAALSRATDIRADGAVTGITSVLVFGAGTNYALLLIARYREELRRTEDRHDAMRAALRSAAPAILASSCTVILALLSLALADDPFITSLGYAGAAGIAIALAFALLVLPAAMVLFGRRLFWPFVPRLGQDEPTRTGPWSRVGRGGHPSPGRGGRGEPGSTRPAHPRRARPADRAGADGAVPREARGRRGAGAARRLLPRRHERPDGRRGPEQPPRPR